MRLHYRLARGFTLIEFYWVVALFGAFIIVFAERVMYYQESAEKAHVDLMVSQLRAAVKTRTAEYMLADRLIELPHMLQENPMKWLEALPDDYMEGDYKDIPSGNWLYDKKVRQLIYKPSRRRYLNVEKSQSDIRWQVRLVIPWEKQTELAQSLYNSLYKNPLQPGQIGVDLILLTPYKWF